MSHGPSVEWKEDKSTGKKAKIGAVMFGIYLVVYAGFVVINVTNPKLMKLDVGSLNLAIVYGFGLIALAVVEAVIYNHFCSHLEERAEKEADKKAAGGESE